MEDEPSVNLKATNNPLNLSVKKSQSQIESAHESRLNKIIDFWFRPGDDINSTAKGKLYDREETMPREYMMRWFK